MRPEDLQLSARSRSAIVMTTILLAACAGETVESHFDGRALAEEHGAFERGLFPAWLPKASKALKERHNLDTNARMWSAEVPVGVEVELPSHCQAAKLAELPPAPFDPSWWPARELHDAAAAQRFIYFRCGVEFVGLAVEGGLLLGWTAGH